MTTTNAVKLVFLCINHRRRCLFFQLFLMTLSSVVPIDITLEDEMSHEDIL